MTTATVATVPQEIVVDGGFAYLASVFEKGPLERCEKHMGHISDGGLERLGTLRVANRGERGNDMIPLEDMIPEVVKMGGEFYWCTGGGCSCAPGFNVHVYRSRQQSQA
jgi:hypothetical protein